MEVVEEGQVAGTAAGRIASVYYLQHTTMAHFARALGPGLGPQVQLLLSVRTKITFLFSTSLTTK